jgi:O-antigen ligase
VGKYNSDFEHHSAHNLWVDIAAESGLVGLILYATLLFAVLLGCIGNVRRWESDASRWVFVSLIAFLGVGLLLTTTMFVLPYILFAVVAIDRNRIDSSATATA